VLAVAVVPALRPGARVWLWCWGILALWFVLARTKTVTWRFVSLVGFAGCLVAPLVGLACVALAAPLGLDVTAQDAAVVLGPVEEAGKLVPLAMLLLVARRRVGRFAVVDFLLVGLASGLGFQAVEDGLRRVWWSARPALGAAGLDASMGLAQYRPGLLPGWHDFRGEAFWPGHHVTTALIAVGIGVAWWLRPRLGRVAWLLPVALFAMAAIDHAMTNVVAYRLGGAQPGPHYVDPPGWLVAMWDAWGSGRQYRPLLIGALLIAIMLDVRRARRVRYLLVPLPGGGWTHRVTGAAERLCRRLSARSSAASAWQRPAARASAALIRLSAWTVADIGQELAVLARAISREPRRRRRPVPRRHRFAATMTVLRQRRELAQELGRDVDRVSAVPPSGLTMLFVLAICCVAIAGLVAVVLAAGSGDGLFLAGLFEAIGGWWGGLTTVDRLLSLTGGAALLTLGGAGGLTGQSVATAEIAFDPRNNAGTARRVVTSLTPAEATAALTALSLAGVAPRASARAAMDLDRLLDVAGVPGFMARRASDLATTAALLGRPPQNSEQAGFTLEFDNAAMAAKYPAGIRFSTFGFPDFAPYAIATVELGHIVGTAVDELRANTAAGLAETPDGHTWHRVEDCRTLLLVPTDLHDAVAHDGGAGVLRALGDRGPS
jgi:hypothetical protein